MHACRHTRSDKENMHLPLATDVCTCPGWYEALPPKQPRRDASVRAQPRTEPVVPFNSVMRALMSHCTSEDPKILDMVQSVMHLVAPLVDGERVGHGPAARLGRQRRGKRRGAR